MKKRVYILLLCIFISTTMMYGCTQSTTNNIVETATPSQENPVDSIETPVYKIGLSAPMTGNWANRGKGFEVAANLAIEKINASGGVKGSKLELIVGDSKGDVKQATAVAEMFIEDKDIIAVVGDYSRACTMAATLIYKLQEESMLQISPSAGNNDFDPVSEYMFSLSGDKDDEAKFIAETLLKEYMGAKKLSIIYLDNDWGKNTSQIISNKWEDAELEVTSFKGYSDGTEDFSKIIEEARITKPDALCVVMYYNDLVNVSKQIKDMDWDIPVCNVGSGMSQKTLDLGGEYVEGLMCVTPFIVSIEDKELIKLSNEFYKRAGFDIDVKSASAYDAVFLIAEAIGNCGEVTRLNIADELSKIKDFQGITGKIMFNPNGDINRQYRIAKVVDGKWVSITEYN